VKVTYPHIGDLTPAVRGMFRRLGVEVIAPPAPGTRVLRTGARHSPETVCLPYKHVLGELIIGLRSGADTLMLLGGRGPCRFGFYDVMQVEVLKSLGYDFRVVSTDNPDTLRNLVRELAEVSPDNSRAKILWELYLFFRRVEAMDHLQDIHNRLVPYNLEEAEGALGDWKERLSRAATYRRIRDVRAAGGAVLRSLPRAPVSRPLRVGVVGEFYTVVDPDTNFHLERVLGRLGVSVERGVWLSVWLNDRLRFMPFWRNDRRRCKRIARPYITFSPGGECVVTVAKVMEFARAGLDGVVHLLPFTCMPELVASTVLGSHRRDFDIPVLELAVDEHTDGTAVRTRVEAFVDTLAWRRRRARC
jgi:predicted nucleotide-binding protein (sugar kinase/HSP70/actin superfamily)